MSVDMNIDWKDGTSQRQPVAAASTCYQYWVPIARHLGLEIVPKFEGWLQIYEFEEVSTVIEELASLKQFLVVSNEQEIPADTQRYMVERVEKLILLLTEARNQWDRVDYVGFG